MMFYIYVRKFDKNKYIGFALAINGYYFTEFQPLFSLFETEIEKLVETGIIIHFSDSGDITSGLSSLKSEEEEVIAVVNSLDTMVNNLTNLKKLPPVDFSVAISSRKIFKDSDYATEIANASCRFGFTIVLKESDYDTVRTTSSRNVIKRLEAYNNDLKIENEELKEENKEIQRQKKQFKKVVILILVVLGCGIGILSLNKNLNITQNRLDSAKKLISEKDDTISEKDDTISEKESVILGKNFTISSLRDSVKGLENILNREVKEKEKIESTLQSICAYTPFAVTGCDISANQFKFNYFCIEEKNVTVILKAINEGNGDIVTSTHSLTFYKGSGSKTLDFYRRLDSSQYYYVVLICNGHIIAGRRW